MAKDRWRGYKRREWSFLSGSMCDSFTLQLLKGEACRAKLAVKAATDDPSHKQPSHISPVIWTGGEKGEKKKAITASLSYVISVMYEGKNRAALVIMTGPKLIFHLRNRHRCSGSYYLNHIRLSNRLYIICYYSLFLLHFNKTSSMNLLPRGHRAWITSRPPLHWSQGYLYFSQ